jgi:hypothetical protein
MFHVLVVLQRIDRGKLAYYCHISLTMMTMSSSGGPVPEGWRAVTNYQLPSYPINLWEMPLWPKGRNARWVQILLVGYITA